MAQIYTESRGSISDLAITFDVGGESAVIYIPMDKASAMSKQEFADMLADPLSCSLCCAKKSGFAACMARCLYGDGRCCDSGATNCE